MKKDNIDNMTISEIKENIESFKQNLSQIESTLEIEEKSKDIESSAKCKALNNLKKDVQNAIAFYTSTLEYKITQSSFNTQPITSKSINKCASLYYELDKKWYNGIINSIDQENKKCSVTFFGYKETEDLPFKYIKPIDEVSPEELTPGTVCDAIYKEDGLWYTCVVERTSELGIHIKFDKYNNEEIVSNDYLRITPEQKITNWKNKEEEKKKKKEEGDKERSKFEIPNELRITPADNEETRLLKRKRVKQLKNKVKQREIEKITQAKQRNWLNFNKTLNGNKKNKTLNGFTPLKIIQK